MAFRPSLRHFAVIIATATSAFGQQLNAMTYLGCYSSSTGLSTANTAQYQTDGLCQQTCVQQKNNQAVLGLTAGSTCLCGGSVPPTSAKVDDSKCNVGCNGFGDHICGGDGFYSVYLTGSQKSASIVGGGTASASASGTTPSATGSSTSTTSAGPSVVTSVAPGQTVTQTAAAKVTPSAEPAAKGSNVAGIAAGVTVGVVVLIAVIAGVLLFMRRRRRQVAEEEYKRTQVANFMAGSKPTIPAMTGPRGPDSRFDAEAMAHHRLSDGSIADNEDYSRRILKVTNA